MLIGRALKDRRNKALLSLVVALPVTACGKDDAPMVAPKSISYFVAAEPVDWNYAPIGRDPAFNRLRTSASTYAGLQAENCASYRSGDAGRGT
jgi:hypothetical protein